MTAVTGRVATRFPRLPLFPPITTYIHTAHTWHWADSWRSSVALPDQQHLEKCRETPFGHQRETVCWCQR